jgi:hypothetical protein
LFPSFSPPFHSPFFGFSIFYFSHFLILPWGHKGATPTARDGRAVIFARVGDAGRRRSVLQQKNKTNKYIAANDGSSVRGVACRTVS